MFILMGLYVIVLHTSCKEKVEVKEAEAKYAVTIPLIRDTSIIKEYVCQIQSIRNIEMRALEKGYLKAVYVNEGQLVKEGQLMFQIMPSLYEAELHKAQAEAHAAEIEVQNARSLAEKNVVSQNELALAQAKLDKANAETELAKVHLDFTRIRAPFSGLMDRLRVRQGSLIDEGDLLTTLSDNSKMWVYFNVPESEYLNYKTSAASKQKMNVQLMMANHQLFSHPGVVETIESEFNSETGNIAFRATFPNTEGLLRHGETGNIEVEVPFPNAILIPQKASFEVLDKKYVYVIDEKNMVKTREIIVAAELPDIYVVSEGLKANEKILLEGLRKVKDGDEIEFEIEDPNVVFTKLRLPAQ